MEVRTKPGTHEIRSSIFNYLHARWKKVESDTTIRYLLISRKVCFSLERVIESRSTKRKYSLYSIFPRFPLPWRSVSPNYNLLNDDRAVLLIIHGGAGRVAVTGLKGGRRRSDKKSSRSGGGLRRGNSRVGDDFRGATR